MLLLKAHCESCNKALSASNAEAKICSFECTFCIKCSDGKLGGLCTNCGGELVIPVGTFVREVSSAHKLNCITNQSLGMLLNRCHC